MLTATETRRSKRFNGCDTPQAAIAMLIDFAAFEGVVLDVSLPWPSPTSVFEDRIALRVRLDLTRAAPSVELQPV